MHNSRYFPAPNTHAVILRRMKQPRRKRLRRRRISPAARSLLALIIDPDQHQRIWTPAIAPARAEVEPVLFRLLVRPEHMPKPCPADGALAPDNILFAALVKRADSAGIPRPVWHCSLLSSLPLWGSVVSRSLRQWRKLNEGRAGWPWWWHAAGVTDEVTPAPASQICTPLPGSRSASPGFPSVACSDTASA